MNHRFLWAIFMITSMLLAGCADDNKVNLFNGQDLGNWDKILFDSIGDPDDVFKVEEGLIKVGGVPKGYILTRDSYSNYKLHVEWRWPGEPANSGVLLHCQGVNHAGFPICIEAQLANGKAGDFIMIGQGSGMSVGESTYLVGPDGKSKRSTKFEAISELAAGEWNEYDITCSGTGIELIVNGVLQNVGFDAAFSAGRIALQSEGGPVEFRNVYLVPIVE